MEHKSITIQNVDSSMTNWVLGHSILSVTSLNSFNTFDATGGVKKIRFQLRGLKVKRPDLNLSVYLSSLVYIERIYNPIFRFFNAKIF